MKYDLHIHSKYSSDGFLDPLKIVKIAIKNGLNGIAITDHDTIKGGLKTKEYETEDFKVIIGEEVTTSRGEIIGLFLEQEIKSSDFNDVIFEIKDQNGLVVIPHPFDEMRNSTLHLEKNDIKYVNNIEIFNSRCVNKKYNDKASIFAKNNNLGVTGGSDAHFANEIGNAGIITETDDLRNAILKNNLEVFGKRSTPLNHVLTKMLKIRRKYF